CNGVPNTFNAEFTLMTSSLRALMLHF
ncbi:MAG: hypothetical protein RL657_1579, partial [Pseudomonadota bacterium]